MQQPQVTTASTKRLAMEAMSAGDFAHAASFYELMLGISRTRTDSATALFGRAFSVQQLTSALQSDSPAPLGAGPIRGDTLRVLLDSYRVARSLDSAKYFAASQYNVGQLLSVVGRHAQAAAELMRGAQTSDSLRGALLLAAAREYDLAGNLPSAVATLQLASRDPRSAGDAQERLVDAYVRLRDVKAVVALADSVRAAAGAARSLNDALLGFMRDPAWSAWRERCLVPLARNFAAMDLGPVFFQGRLGAELALARKAASGTEIAAAIDALVDAYRVRDSTEHFAPAPGARWWLSSMDRAKVWSSTLRSLGDWYVRNGRITPATNFYESALGPNFNVDAPWIDLAALPPLATIYASLPADQAAEKTKRLEQFEVRLFEGKALALAENDLLRIRMFRLTLGTLYAREGRWDGGYRGATLQLEMMRKHTKDLRSFGIIAYDPPDVLELLMNEYQRRGCTTLAADVGREVRDEYTRRGATADAARVTQILTDMQQKGLVSCASDQVG